MYIQRIFEFVFVDFLEEHRMYNALFLFKFFGKLFILNIRVLHSLLQYCIFAFCLNISPFTQYFFAFFSNPFSANAGPYRCPIKKSATILRCFNLNSPKSSLWLYRRIVNNIIFKCQLYWIFFNSPNTARSLLCYYFSPSF